MYQNVFIESGDGLGRGVVHIWDDEQGYTTLPYNQFDYAYKPDRTGRYISMTGVRLAKTNRYNREDRTLYESDLPRETRVLTDLYLESDEPSAGHTVLFFDIEVSMENGIPNIESPNNEVTSIAGYDAVADEYFVLVLDKEKLYPNKIDGNVTITFHHSEIDLIYAFLDKYEEIMPTIISGWNSDGFDVPYLYNRISQQCGQNTAGRLSPIGKVKYSRFKNKYQLAGVSALDYMILYKKFTFGDRPNYRLNTIGHLEVGMGKIEYEGTLDELFKNDLDTFIKYNLRDVKILVELDKKLKFIELARGICHLGHVPYEDFWYSSKFLEGTIVTYLHRKGIIVTNKPEGGREMMEEKDDDEDEGFKGAYVRPPMPGLYDWVYSLDLQSLYPSIIMSLNISPETKMGFVTNWDAKKHKENSLTEYLVRTTSDDTITSMTRDKFVAFMEEMNYFISSNGVLYNANVVGIIPEILDVWFQQRVEFKDLMKKHKNENNEELAEFYDRRQHIQKIFLNSLYGVLGLPIFRFFDIDNALAVTASGQDVIKSSAKFLSNIYHTRGAEEKTTGYLLEYKKALKRYKDMPEEDVRELMDPRDYCIYIDTDSLYFSSVSLNKNNVDDKEFTIKLARAAESALNKYYDSLAKDIFFCKAHRLVIKGESVAQTGIWLAKKRYALSVVYDLESNVDVAGKVKVKGLDTVRSSFPPAFRDFMNTMQKDMLNKVPKDEVDVKVLSFRDNLNKMSYMDVARNTSVKDVDKWDKGSETINDFMKGAPAAVKAAISYNLLLKNLGLVHKFAPISNGEKIKWLYLKKNPYNLETIALKGDNDPPEITKLAKEYIDYSLLFEKELKKKIEDFYHALKWGNIPTEVNQRASLFFEF